MLFTEDPSHPPCPSKISELTGDGKAAKNLTLQEAADLVKGAVPEDEIQQQAPFSIRSYVCAARSKDIGINWPFPQHLLQLCLKHGVKDLLPPLQCPQLVRSQHCRQDLVPRQPVALVDSERTSQEVDLVKEDVCFLHVKSKDSKIVSCQSPLSEVVEEENAGLLDLEPNDSKNVSCQPFTKSSLEPSDCAQSPLSEVDVLLAERGDEQLFPSEVGGDDSAPEAPLVEFDAVKPPQTSNTTDNLCKSSGKKRRLIVKFSGNCDSSRAEENVSNSSIAMESMASKICPVCKTFSSTSNTTLNAHIDQCLAADSTYKWDATKVNKQKVKASKKRLMVDIYLTAPHCTLEDLERRSSTNWAINSVLPMENAEVDNENKRQQMIQINYNGDGEESPVYVDSSGTKLRILSKLNDSTMPTALKNCNPERNTKGSEDDKSFLLNERKHIALTASKCLNVKPQSKKLCNMSPKSKIHKASDTKYDVDKNHEKEERPSQLLKAQDSFGRSRCGTLRQWVCSRRMHLSKKFNGRSINYGTKEDPSLVTNKSLFHRKRSNSGNSSIKRGHIHKLSRFSVSSDASQDVRSKVGNLMDNKVNFSKPVKNNSNQLIKGPSFLPDGNSEIFSRSLEHNIAPNRSTRVEIDRSTAKRPPEFSNSSPSSLKVKKTTISKNTLWRTSSLSVESSKCNRNRELSPRKKSRKSTFKRPQKDRCTAKMRDLAGEYPIDEEKGTDRMQDSTEIPGPSNSVMVFETEEFASTLLIGRCKVPKSRGQKEDAVIALDRPESITSKRSLSTNECFKLDGINVDSEVGGVLHQYMSTGIYPIKTRNQKFSAEDVAISADAGITPNGQSYSSFSLGEAQVEPIFGTKAWVEPITPRLCDVYDDQEMHYTGGSEEGCTSSQAVTEVDYLLERNSSVDQYMGCGTESISIQEAGDGGLDALLEKLLVTSSGPGFIDYQHELVNINPSESLTSATATISPPPVGSSSFSFSGMELTDNSTKRSLVDAIDSGPSVELLTVETAKLERRNTEVKISPGKEPAKISDYEPCYFLQKESANAVPAPVYHESAKLMQMASNQNVSPENFSSFMNHQSLRANEKAYPAYGMQMGPICMKESLHDAAKSMNGTGLGLASPFSKNRLTSSPILRLMGQNLMVTNNDEDKSLRLVVDPLESVENNRASERNASRNGSQIGNICGQDTLPSGLPQNSNVEFSSSSRNCGNSKVSPTHSQLPFVHQDRLGGFMVSGSAALRQ